jgi:hypothetical protein
MTTYNEVIHGRGLKCDNEELYCNNEQYYCDGSVSYNEVEPEE